METGNLRVRLRHATSEPVTTEISPDLLSRIRRQQTAQAIQEILQSAPEEKKAYANAMLQTMESSNSVVEVACIHADNDVDVVTVDRQKPATFGDMLDRLSQGVGRDQQVEEIEIGAARLEKGGLEG